MIMFNNLIWLSLLLVFGYKLVRQAAQQGAGIIFVVLTLAHPMIFEIYTKYLIDNTLPGAMVMCLYFLLNTGEFSDMKNSLAFAAAFGLGMLCKQPFIVYIAGPSAYVLFLAFKKILKGDKTVLKNVVFSLSLLTVITAVFYLSWDVIQSSAASPFSEVQLKDPINYNLSSRNILVTQMGLPLLSVFLLSLYPFMKYGETKLKIILLSGVIIPHVVLYLMPHMSEPRFYLPVNAVMLVISAIGWGKILNSGRFSAVFAAALTCMIGIASFQTFYEYYHIKAAADGSRTIAENNLYETVAGNIKEIFGGHEIFLTSFTGGLVKIRPACLWLKDNKRIKYEDFSNIDTHDSFNVFMVSITYDKLLKYGYLKSLREQKEYLTDINPDRSENNAANINYTEKIRQILENYKQWRMVYRNSDYLVFLVYKQQAPIEPGFAEINRIDFEREGFGRRQTYAG